MSASRISKIGLLVVTAIALLIWGVSYLKGNNLFKKENTYYVIYNEVNGLSISNAVLINGFKVGQVLHIEYIPDTVDRFRVSISIENKFKLVNGSIAQVYSQDIMGNRAIRIIRGKLEGFHENGDTLIAAVEGGLVEQVNMEIAPLKKKAESLISSLDSAIIIVREIFNKRTQEDLRNTFASIKNTIANLEKTTFTLDTLLTTEKSKLAMIFSNVEAITANLKNNDKEISNIIKNFSAISDSLAKADIASTLGKADSALLQFNQILANINSGNGTVGQLIHNDTLYRNIENASYHLSRLMRDMHENPKRYLHFSVLDVGKTIYVADPDDKKAKKKKQNDQRKSSENEMIEK
jgi:phospholipid/cholesterol/gamma-HCH transport system substrate-binding protein